MNRLIRFTLSMGALPLAACGSEPTFPPQPCAAIADQTLNVGATETVAPCFADPDGHEVTLSVTSSDESVVIALIQRSALIVEAVDVGSAVVTVTGTDPEGKTAEIAFTVDVPNRGPEADENGIAPVALATEDPMAEVILTPYFSDPDGHPLSFAAESSDPAIVSTTVTDSVLALSGHTSGSVTVEVIATDPHGLSAEAVLEVTVEFFEMLLRDDFDSLSVRWQKEGAPEVIHEDGRVGVRSTDDVAIGLITQDVSRGEYWEVAANLEIGAMAVDSWPTLIIGTGDKEVGYILVLVGADFRRINDSAPETNLIAVYGNSGRLFSPPGWHGIFDGIKGPGEPMDVLVHRNISTLDISVDGTMVLSVGIPQSIPNSVTSIALANWGAFEAELGPDEFSYFDWIQVDGFKKSASRLGYATPSRFPFLNLPRRIER